MGFKYSFIDSEVYGTEDVNSIVSSLTGAGIAPFLSKDSYNVSDLNSLTSAIAEPGTELDGCKCTGVHSDNVLVGVNVAKGIIYFESGVCLTVDEAGANVPVEKDASGFVYAHFSPSLQVAKFEFAADLPADGEYVILARIDENGRVWDERTFARSKIATIGSNLIIEKKFESITPVLYEKEGSYNWYIIAEINGVNLSQHSYIMVNRSDNNFYTFVFYDIKNDEILISAETPKNSSNEVVKSGLIYTMDYDVYCYFKVMEGKPVIVARCREGYERYLHRNFEAKIM